MFNELSQELGETACAGAEAVAALAADAECRARFARAHALHALLPAVLRYDYTLAESGLHKEGDNKQVNIDIFFKLHTFILTLTLSCVS